MAAGILQKPGTKFGHCAEECKHIDCKQLLEIAAAVCRICAKAIGYEARFYREDDEALVHAICLEEEIEGLR